MEKLKNTKVLGFPLWMFLVLNIIMIFLASKDWMLSNMIGALGFALIVGTMLGWIGDHIPIWNSWFGGGMLFT